MDVQISRFLELFRALSGDAAEAWCGDREALGKLFKGSSYSQRRADWFPAGDTFPRRTMQPHDYKVLRNLIASAANRRGERTVTEAELRHLDLAYQTYVVALEARDARRNRGLIGRTLHVSAARRRLGRFLDQRNCSPNRILGRDAFDQFLETHVLELRKDGDELNCTRLLRTICLLLREDPGFFGEVSEDTYAAAAHSALCGVAGASVLGDEYGSVYFVNYLKDLYRQFPDPLIMCELWVTDAYDRNQSEGHYKCLAAFDQAPRSRLFGNSRSYRYDCAANAAVKVDGFPVNAPVRQLGWRSPQQLFTTRLDDWVANPNGYSPEEIATGVSGLYATYADCMICERKLDEARRWIQQSREALPSSARTCWLTDMSSMYLGIQALKLEWYLTGSPAALVTCVQEVDKAVALLNERYMFGMAAEYRKLQPKY